MYPMLSFDPRWKRVALGAGLCGVLLVVLCAGRPASAVRVVPQRTLQPVSADECTNYSMSRQSDGTGSAVRVVTATFEIKDENGVVRETVTVSKQLTTGESNSLNAAINTMKDAANVAANL